MKKRKIKLNAILEKRNTLDQEKNDIVNKKAMIDTLKKEVNELENKVEYLENEIDAMEKLRYQDMKLRKQLVDYAFKNNMIIIAKQLEEYVDDEKWDKNEISDEILNGFFDLDVEKRLQNNIIERMDSIISKKL